MSNDIRKQCDDLVLAMVGERLAPMWWTKANKRFDGETPDVAFKRSPNEVYEYLLTCAFGGW